MRSAMVLERTGKKQSRGEEGKEGGKKEREGDFLIHHLGKGKPGGARRFPRSLFRRGDEKILGGAVIVKKGGKWKGEK